MDYVDVLRDAGVIPVITINDASKAPYVAEALANGGINCAEITFRTAAAAEAIDLISKTIKDFYVAAGTVLTKTQLEDAVRYGAKLIVAPGYNKELLDYSKELRVPFIPGVATPSEIDAALYNGFDILKLFPAEAMGGVKYLKAVSAPYHMVKFMPTGGISPDNLKDYLSLKQVVCCGGSWIAPAKLIDACDYGSITRLAIEASQIVKEAKQ